MPDAGSTFCLLLTPTTCYLLLATYYLLLTAYHSLQVLRTAKIEAGVDVGKAAGQGGLLRVQIDSAQVRVRARARVRGRYRVGTEG